MPGVAADAGRFVEVGRVPYGARVRAVEVTLTAEGALAALGRLRAELPSDALLGVGTARSVGDAERAVEAGAAYLVAPDLRAEVVAWAAGATAVKVFPASAVGDPVGDLDALAGRARRAVAAATGTAR